MPYEEDPSQGKDRPVLVIGRVTVYLLAVPLTSKDHDRDKEQEEAVEERRRDYKTELQELVQRRSNQTLHYEMIGATGPDHAKLFTCAVLLNGQTAGTGTGKSKKEAEQAAARAALQALQ